MKTQTLMIIGALLSLGAGQTYAADIAAGEAEYASVCSNCHGPTGRGMASFPAVTGKDAEYIAAKLTAYRAGEQVGPNSALMIPNARDLSDDDIANLAAFIADGLQ